MQLSITTFCYVDEEYIIPELSLRFLHIYSREVKAILKVPGLNRFPSTLCIIPRTLRDNGQLFY